LKILFLEPLMLARRIASILFLITLAVLPANAFARHSNATGCTDSPEAPTLILALASGGGLLAARFRMRK